MVALFVIASDVAVAATILAITSRATLHALLHLAISLVAVAVVFYIMGAPFVAGLEIIIYAGAIVVLFMFAVMLLSPTDVREVRHRIRVWLGPMVLSLVLLGELVYLMFAAPGAHLRGAPYAVGVELASFLLLAALLGARHLGSQHNVEPEEAADAARAPAAAELHELEEADAASAADSEAGETP